MRRNTLNVNEKSTICNCSLHTDKIIGNMNIITSQFKVINKWKEKYGSIPPTDVVVLVNTIKSKKLRDCISKTENF